MGKDDFSAEMVNKLGARIKQLREQKGYSNAEKFAYLHNISRSQYARYEKGEDLRFSSLIRIIRAHEMNIKDFFSEGFD